MKDLSRIEKRLESIDKEVHSILAEIRSAPKRKITSEEIVRHMSADRKLDIDTTELIRKMRDREYL